MHMVGRFGRLLDAKLYLLEYKIYHGSSRLVFTRSRFAYSFFNFVEFFGQVHCIAVIASLK